MLGSKKSLGYAMLGSKTPLGKNIFGSKMPLGDMLLSNKVIGEKSQKKIESGLERRVLKR